jgi:branched-chain amino acid transport system ATP-binding protein
MTALVVDSVRGGYVRGVDAIHGVSLEVPSGAVVSLLGVNGAGKSTLLRLIAGTMKLTAGTISFGGEAVGKLSAPARVARGITLVPQGQQLFPGMTVHENLQLGAYGRHRKADRMRATMELVTTLFPALAPRMSQRCSSLSGGERAMVAVGRGLMSDPSLLLLDEPSAGLAPSARARLFTSIKHLAQNQGLTVLIAEQDVDNALAASSGVYVLQTGEVAAKGDPATIAGDIFGALTGMSSETTPATQPS